MKRDSFFSDLDDHSLPNDLCVAPLKIAKSDEPHKSFQRKTLEYEADFKDMIIKNADYQTQYAPLYFSRLKAMRPWVLEKIKEQDKDSVPVRSQLKEVKLKEECWVVGTLFREMEDRPNALDAYIGKAREEKERYASKSDRMVIEDETGRAVLSGLKEQKDQLCTGLIVGLRCWEKENGELEVLQLLMPGFAEQSSNTGEETKSESKGLLALACGQLGTIKGQLLADLLSGNLGAPRLQHQLAQVARVVLAGNTVGQLELQIKHHHQQLSAEETARLLDSLHTVDMVLAQMCSSVHVDLMPGQQDPSNSLVPQQPFNVTLFPYASRYSSFHAVSNPYRARVGAADVMVMSGQNLDNVMKYSLFDSRLDAAVEMVRSWRHIAPNAPDTLPSYPFESDPFVLSHTPHLLVISNQPQYATRLLSAPNHARCRVVLLPAYAETGLLLLFNPETLDVQPVYLDVKE